MTKLAVLGGGAWGTALAASLARAGKNPVLWARDQAVVDDIGRNRKNTKYLGDIRLPEGIHPTTDPAALRLADVILVSVPTQTLRPVLSDLCAVIERSAILVLCAKGIETTTGSRVSAIAADVMADNRLAILSGPSFAVDVARWLPTAVTLAAASIEEASAIAEEISAPAFRPYASDDIIGVEIGGALKNVIALAVGMARAQGLGASAEAALTTRGFAELARIARHFGGKSETLMGLSCLGDLMLTCSSPQSRNFAYGMAVGRGEKREGLRLAEGVYTTRIACAICEKAGIDAPIIRVIDAVLSEKIDLDAAMAALLARPLKKETD
ncbi:MAG: NAD(P)-dependent glycerol-3-phosphate dehydrogenase [Rhizobiales bacterium]|nr:NAD(P)-dependent glycerol-3-phosphate dehydrogenase [Hyphomicrobiales bacterium]